MLAMTLYKCGFAVFSAGHQMRVTRLFARDGLIWFLLVMLFSITNIIVWSVGRTTIAQVQISMICSLCSIIASRILFNIKEVMHSTDNLTVMSPTALGDIELSPNSQPSRGTVTRAEGIEANDDRF